MATWHGYLLLHKPDMLDAGEWTTALAALQVALDRVPDAPQPAHRWHSVMSGTSMIAEADFDTDTITDAAVAATIQAALPAYTVEQIADAMTDHYYRMRENGTWIQSGDAAREMGFAYTYDSDSLERYVASDGTPSGSGAIDAPMDIATGLTKYARAGATIYLRAGTHKLDADLTATVAGSAESHVIVRPYANERAVIDLDASNLALGGAHVTFMDLEICSRNTGNRTSTQMSSAPTDIVRRWFGVNTTVDFYGCTIHDVNNFGWWSAALGGTIADCLIYHCGWTPPPGMGPWGHGMYTQNLAASPTKNAINTIMGPSLGLGFAPRGSEAGEVSHYRFTKCTSLSGDDRFSGYSCDGVDIVIDDCVFWTRVILENVHAGNGNALINSFINGLVQFIDATAFTLTDNIITCDAARQIIMPAGGSFVIDRNTYHLCPRWQVGDTLYTDLAAWQAATGYDLNSTYSADPPAPRTVVTPCEYSARRVAHITVIDYSEPESVEVDVSECGMEAGASYRLRSAYDPENDYSEFVYDGSGAITVALAGRTVATPVGLDAPIDTVDPRFGAWILETL